MQNRMRSIVVGALALTGATFAAADVEAMPIQPLAQTVTADTHLDQVYYYGYRRPLLRYGYRRPFLGYRRFGYYGYRRPFLFPRRPFYGYRRPFLGYGFRRF